jgi:hypothetical protein
MTDWQNYVELHRLYREARNNRDSFFERLALLDGGTVALVVTAILGPLHGMVPHKHLLAVGLTFLVGALVALLCRNLLAAHFEFHLVGETANDPRMMHPMMQRRAKWLSCAVEWSQNAGLLLSALGIVLLLVEVWLIL